MYKITIEHTDGMRKEIQCRTLILATIDQENHAEGICLSEEKHGKIHLAGAFTAITGLMNTIYKDTPGLRELTQECIEK